MPWHVRDGRYLIIILFLKTYFKVNSPAIIMVLELPPRLSLRSHVRTESRYGMKVELRLAVGSWGLLLSFARDEITSPKVTRLLLI